MPPQPLGPLGSRHSQCMACCGHKRFTAMAAAPSHGGIEQPRVAIAQQGGGVQQTCVCTTNHTFGTHGCICCNWGAGKQLRKGSRF